MNTAAAELHQSTGDRKMKAIQIEYIGDITRVLVFEINEKENTTYIDDI